MSKENDLQLLLTVDERQSESTCLCLQVLVLMDL